MLEYKTLEMVQALKVIDESLTISRIYQIRDGIFLHFHGTAHADVDLRLNPERAYKIQFYAFGYIIILESDYTLNYNVLRHHYYPNLSLMKNIHLDFSKDTYEKHLTCVEDSVVMKSKWKLVKDISEIEDFDVVKFCKDYKNEKQSI